LSLLAQGYNNNEIASRSELSVKSVERWIDIIYKELAISKNDDATRQQARQWLDAYNRDDVKATFAVRNYLRELPLA
jgi:DNA-binding NarL/FixJ family response regulator